MPKEKRPLSSDSGSGSSSGSGSGSDSDCSRSPTPPPAKKPKGKTYDNKTFGNSSKPRVEKPKAKVRPSGASSNVAVGVDTDAEGNPIWTVGAMKKVTVRKFKGSIYIDVREYYSKDGKDMPGKKGISLKPEQWHTLKSLSDEIDDAILRA